jgi:hypothetical protein
MRLAAVAFAALALVPTQAPSKPAIVLRTADAVPPQPVVQSLAAVSDILQSRGFRLADSPLDADVIVELLSRRSIARRVSVNNTRLVTNEMLSAQATEGDAVAQFRGYSGYGFAINATPELRVAEQLEQWLAERPRTPKTPARLAPTSPLNELLARASKYVTEYEEQFSTVIGDERYAQRFTQMRSIDRETATTRPTVDTRTLKSEVSLSWFPDVHGWFGFRDVIDVDGKPLKDRDRRLATLFFTKPTGKLLKQALQESSRYNLGTIRRNFNVPMVALQFLAADIRSHFRFEEAQRERIGDVTVRVVRYQEIGHPTMILVDEMDAPSSGRFWIEPDTGRVLKTELVNGDRNADIRIVTWYKPDARLEMLAPARMTESYDYTQRLYDAIECEATYTNFRRFETGARIVTPKP